MTVELNAYNIMLTAAVHVSEICNLGGVIELNWKQQAMFAIFGHLRCTHTSICIVGRMFPWVKCGGCLSSLYLFAFSCTSDKLKIISVSEF